MSEPGGSPTSLVAVERFLEAVDAGKGHEAVLEVLDEVRLGASIRSVIDERIAPVQRQVGERWAVGSYSVADEHRVTGLVEELLGLLALYAGEPDDDRVVVLVSADGDWHVAPARMLSLALREAGWRVQFLGGPLPASQLATSLARLGGVTALLVSCTLPLALPGVPPMVAAAHARGVPVLVGGRGFDGRAAWAQRLGADAFATDVEAAVEVLQRWHADPPSVAPPPVVTDEAASVLGNLAREQLTDRALARVAVSSPAYPTYDERQRAHTRRDLAYLVQALDAALLVEDGSLLTAFVTWTDQVLRARGVPTAELFGGLVAIRDALPADRSDARELLDASRRALPAVD